MVLQNHRTAKALGFLAGLVLAAVLLLQWRIEPAQTSPPGASLELAAEVPGELGGPTREPALVALDLQPGGRGATGSVSIRNESGRALQIGVRIAGEADRLDELLALKVSARSAELARGRLSRLRDATGPTLVLDPRARAKLDVRAWLPASGTDGYEALSGERRLVIVASPVEEESP